VRLVRSISLENQCFRSELAAWYKSHELSAAAALWTTCIPLLENRTFEEGSSDMSEGFCEKLVIGNT
jgi:hypothetical protein